MHTCVFKRNARRGRRFRCMIVSMARGKRCGPCCQRVENFLRVDLSLLENMLQGLENSHNVFHHFGMKHLLCKGFHEELVLSLSIC
jgi:hypothetical protein